MDIPKIETQYLINAIDHQNIVIESEYLFFRKDITRNVDLCFLNLLLIRQSIRNKLASLSSFPKDGQKFECFKYDRNLGKEVYD